MSSHHGPSSPILDPRSASLRRNPAKRLVTQRVRRVSLALALAACASAAAAGPGTGISEWPLGSLDATLGAEITLEKSRLAAEGDTFQGDTFQGDIAEPDAEHAPIAVHGITAAWSLGPIAQKAQALTSPDLVLRLLNHDDVDYLVSVRGIGDAGSLETKHAGARDQTYIAAGSGRELAIRLDAGSLGPMSFSGTVYVSFDACPVGGGACISGTSESVFYHAEAGRTLVYGERVLCEQFGCGDLARAEPQEPGTLRVLGGQPLLGDLPTDEADPVSPIRGTPVPSLKAGAPEPGAPEPGAKAAVPITLCVKADIQTTDSGQTANGIMEDHWTGANTPGSYIVTGRGFRLKVSWGGWSRTLDTHPTTGCVTFLSPLPFNAPLVGASVRVYGYATDSAGNRVRIHNAGTGTGSWYPGATYSALWSGQVLIPFAAHNYVLDGRASDRWTTIAAAAYGLYRYHNGNAGATISIGFSENNCNSSGSIHGNAENYIESNNAHLLRIGRCPSSSSDAREKMIITHELGHAMLRMYYGYDGDDSPRDQGYDPPDWVPTASPPQGTNCWNVSSYDMNSLERNSQTFKEAFADFFSAKVWNNKASRGTYVYRSTAFDLETWDNVGNVHAAGGFTQNWCNLNSPSGAISTKGDYLRFLWDFYTVAGCASQPSKLDMFRIYRMVRENHRTGVFNLTTSSYDDALEYAIENSVATLSGCEQQGFDAYASYNGI